MNTPSPHLTSEQYVGRRWRLIGWDSGGRTMGTSNTNEKMTRGQALMAAAVRFPNARRYGVDAIVDLEPGEPCPRCGGAVTSCGGPW